MNRHPNGEAAFYGEYLELDPPGRVVFQGAGLSYDRLEDLLTELRPN